MPVDYQNGKIYTIRSLSRPELVYIGSTTQSLPVRFGGHKRDMKAGRNTSSREVLSIGDAYIELLEEYQCSNKMELDRREGHYIRSMECVNKRIEGRTKEEYYQDNKEAISAHKKQHYQDNKEAISAHNRQYRQNNKEAISAQKKQYRQDNKEAISAHNRQRYQDNRESRIEQMRQYRQNNKEAISAKKKQHYRENNERRRLKNYCYECEKGFTTPTDLLRHEATQKHKDTYNNMFLETFGIHPDDIS